MEKFKEKKIVNVLNKIGLSIFLLFPICLVLGLFINILLVVAFLAIPTAAIFVIPSQILSDKDKYTSEFLKYFRKRLQYVQTLEDLKEIRIEFESLAIEKGHYCIGYVVDVKRLHKEIIDKIEISEQFNTKQ